MASKVEIANQALVLIGADLITSLDDNTKNAKTCKALFDQVRDEVLSEHPWKCAKGRKALAALDGVDETTLFNYKFAYPIPSDFLWIVEPQQSDMEYMAEGTNILANEGPPFNIIYVKRIDDMNVLRPYVREVIAAKLGWKISPTITGKDSVIARMEKQYDKAMAFARYRDSLEKSVERLESDTFLDAHDLLVDDNIKRGIKVP